MEPRTPIMAEHISVSQISKHVGHEVTVKGWVYNRTDKGKLCFLLVRDGSGFVQCVAFKGDLEPEVFDKVMRLPQESAVIITGAVREDKRAPGIRSEEHTSELQSPTNLV